MVKAGPTTRPAIGFRGMTPRSQLVRTPRLSKTIVRVAVLSCRSWLASDGSREAAAGGPLLLMGKPQLGSLSLNAKGTILGKIGGKFKADSARCPKSA